LAIFLFFLWLVPISAQFDFDAAAQAYTNGDYPTAISIYESAIAAGVRDGSVFFNLATAYFAVGDDAPALLNYLRAAEFIPRDSDTQLQIARLRARREDGTLPETEAITLLGTVTNSWLTYPELNFLTWCCWATFFAILAALIWRKRWRLQLRWALMLAGGGLCLFLLLLLTRRSIQEATPTAVVMESAVQVMNGAGEHYLPLFRVFAAAEVRILEERDGWGRVSLPDGRQGWLLVDAVKKPVSTVLASNADS
jgi:tetratricopeptide (TPR) repeat protein